MTALLHATGLQSHGLRPHSAATPARRRADATAADHAIRNVPVVQDTATAGVARSEAIARPDGGSVYVLNERGELSGILSVTTLLALAESETIAPHVDPCPATVPATADQEQVAMAAVRYGLTAVPVNDPQGRFLGVVPAAQLLSVLMHEHREDLDRLAGILRQKEHWQHSLDEPPMNRVAERLPWLLVGLLGSALATWVVAGFEAALQHRVAVAFFIPGIVYLADAIGTQTEAVAVRALSFRTPHVLRAFLGELRTGLLLGLALAAPVLPAIAYAFGDVRLGAAVSGAIVCAGTLAAGIGFAFPLLLSRCNRDPALGSGPLATVVQDVLSLVAYFLAVQWLLPR